MKYLYLFIICLVFTACSGEDDSPVSNENTAPNMPNLSYPTNNLLCIENNIEFQWSASNDPEGDPISYQLEISSDNGFSSLEKSLSTIRTSLQVNLERGKMYYWRVKATDTKSASSEYSEVFNFYTEGDGIENYLPFAPQLISPEMDSEETGDSVLLEWTADDADGDTLMYDVFFGTDASSLEKVATEITDSEYSVDLSSSATYYWKIEVMDGSGGSTIGQVWSFTKS